MHCELSTLSLCFSAVPVDQKSRDQQRQRRWWMKSTGPVPGEANMCQDSLSWWLVVVSWSGYHKYKPEILNMKPKRQRRECTGVRDVLYWNWKVLFTWSQRMKEESVHVLSWCSLQFWSFGLAGRVLNAIVEPCPNMDWSNTSTLYRI